MEWEKVGVNRKVDESFFPVLLKRDDGKIIFLQNLKEYKRKVAWPWRWQFLFTGFPHRWQWMMKIEK